MVTPSSAETIAIVLRSPEHFVCISNDFYSLFVEGRAETRVKVYDAAGNSVKNEELKAQIIAFISDFI